MLNQESLITYVLVIKCGSGILMKQAHASFTSRMKWMSMFRLRSRGTADDRTAGCAQLLMIEGSKRVRSSARCGMLA